VHRGHPDWGDSFTAFISETEGRLEGTVIDDDGPGPASLSGSYAFPSLAFTKVYSRGGAVKHEEKTVKGKKFTIYGVYGPPVEYEGSMSEDGKRMEGTWVINGERGLAGRGSWTAYRVEWEEGKESKETEQEIKVKQVIDDLV
jgi:hypothetical protein